MKKAEAKPGIALRLAAALLIAVAILQTVAYSRASATGDKVKEKSAAASSIPSALTPVGSRSVSAYRAVPITLWGSTVGAKALVIGGSLYVPMRPFAAKIGANVSYNAATRTLSVGNSGLHITVTDGSYVTYVNDRPFFNGKNSVIMNDGRMYVPIETVMKAFGLSYTRGSDGSVRIFGTYTPAKRASEFYRADEVLWLSRIISAESRGEPLLGQIAVGSVVMNRVASAYYPNTIYGVIFDRKYGVQFSPVLDGTIYNTPTYNCILAAKICLEGVRVGNGALFFLRPETSQSLWIPKERRFLYSIGNHDFYA